ncbi:uncharacterized protein PG998_009788 [Apiospora kogelbergensis]|uniref:Uncharacterized protein n=1 Tax=Apiospora kogelbergensis TaxID=1337665 RepID=A0AAW0R8P8_9PEZI
MPSDLNAGEIFAFLAGRNGDEERFCIWRNQTSLFDYDSTSSVDLDLTRYHMDLAPAAPASTRSGSTSTTSTRSASTTFSRKSHRSHYTAASSPPRSVAQSVFIGNATPNLPRPVLPCEYARLGLCTAIFGPDETQIWWEHIAGSHLQWVMPHHCICWFCDQEFSSKDIGVDPNENFTLRLEHIRGHIIEEGYTDSDMRPDYFLLEHMYRHGLLPEIHYRRAREVEEGPSTSGIVDHDYKPPERRRQKELESRVIHDNGKEDRHRRRQERHHRSGLRRVVHGVVALSSS